MFLQVGSSVVSNTELNLQSLHAMEMRPFLYFINKSLFLYQIPYNVLSTQGCTKSNLELKGENGNFTELQK